MMVNKNIFFTPYKYVIIIIIILRKQPRCVHDVIYVHCGRISRIKSLPNKKSLNSINNVKTTRVIISKVIE